MNKPGVRLGKSANTEVKRFILFSCKHKNCLKYFNACSYQRPQTMNKTGAKGGNICKVNHMR